MLVAQTVMMMLRVAVWHYLMKQILAMVAMMTVMYVQLTLLIWTLLCIILLNFYRAAWTRYYDEISVRLSVCLSNACSVTKRMKDMFRFLYHTEEHLS